MYEFNDTIRGTPQASYGIDLIFGGVSLNSAMNNENGNFYVANTKGRDLLNFVHDTADVNGRHGRYYYGQVYDVREIEVTVLLSGKSDEMMRKQYESLNALLYATSPKKLVFGDDSDRYYRAVFSKSSVNKEVSNSMFLTLTFTCHDPFKYSLTKSQSLAVTRYNITYNGDFPCKPKMTIKTQAGSEIVLTHVQTGKYIRLKGTYIAGPSLVIDCASRKITLNGRNELANFDMVNSRFFEFTKGTNTLNVTGGTLINVEWQEVFA